MRNSFVVPVPMLVLGLILVIGSAGCSPLVDFWMFESSETRSAGPVDTSRLRDHENEHPAVRLDTLTGESAPGGPLDAALFHVYEFPSGAGIPFDIAIDTTPTAQVLSLEVYDGPEKIADAEIVTPVRTRLVARFDDWVVIRVRGAWPAQAATLAAVSARAAAQPYDSTRFRASIRFEGAAFAGRDTAAEAAQLLADVNAILAPTGIAVDGADPSVDAAVEVSIVERFDGIHGTAWAPLGGIFVGGGPGTAVVLAGTDPLGAPVPPGPLARTLAEGLCRFLSIRDAEEAVAGRAPFTRAQVNAMRGFLAVREH